MPTFEPFNWYKTPLYYDIVFDEETSLEPEFLCDILARHGGTSGKRVLEPACGSGRLLAAMARRGFTVTGFDLSEPMLGFAKKRLHEQGLKGRLCVADMADFVVPGAGRFDLAHCLVCSFKYLLSEDEARSHLNGIADALAPGGVYVLGIHLTDYEDRHKNHERWVSKRDDVEVVCNIQGWPADPKMRRELVRARLIVNEGETQKRYETHWTFRTYGIRQMKSLLKSVPRLEHVATYDFYHDIAKTIPFDGERLDTVLVLRRA
ncbi:MAG: class I SAM-dependent methyltransferase [Planctomycetota bacterium]|nr:class I SAM-dependent methyltransferase [Planctomycetota bacterium]